MSDTQSQDLRVAVLAVAILASGCSRNPDAMALDDRIVWTAEGCAFTMQRGLGDVSFVRRMSDADKSTCTKVVNYP